jgi:hypothetical protein
VPIFFPKPSGVYDSSAIVENCLISHIDQRFDSLSQLITRQQPSISSISTQDEFEIAEEPTISEPNLN